MNGHNNTEAWSRKAIYQISLAEGIPDFESSLIFEYMTSYQSDMPFSE
jgi:hypothetical protein